MFLSVVWLANKADATHINNENFLIIFVANLMHVLTTYKNDIYEHINLILTSYPPKEKESYIYIYIPVRTKNSGWNLNLPSEWLPWLVQKIRHAHTSFGAIIIVLL